MRTERWSGAAFRRIDPPQVRPSIELRDRVEERSRVRRRGQGLGDIGRKVVPLGAFGSDHHLDGGPASGPTVTVPGRPEHDLGAPPPASTTPRSPQPSSVPVTW